MNYIFSKKFLAVTILFLLLVSIASHLASANIQVEKDRKIISATTLTVHVYFDNNQNGRQDAGERNAIFAPVHVITSTGFSKTRITFFSGNAKFVIPVDMDNVAIQMVVSSWCLLRGNLEDVDSLMYEDTIPYSIRANLGLH